MTEFVIVLVEPKYEGNIGSIARAMKNFALSNLVIINPSSIGVEARKRAMHGFDILESAMIVNNLDEALLEYDLIVGTTGITTKNEKKFLRRSLPIKEFAKKVSDVDGKVAILFGRENFGLLTDELKRCDLIVTIPADEAYPILNIAHAAAIIFHELFQQPFKENGRRISAIEKEKLHEAFSKLLTATDYPRHKLERTKVMFRRMVGRAAPSKWEFHALMGVFTRATNRIKRLESSSRKKPPK